MPLTPMMQQYHEAKQAAGDALLLFRMGDFYELFGDDAKTAARLLGLSLTSRDKGENALPMAGFPHHQLDQYLAKIIAAGHRAAVCEQVEDPRQAKGLVRRDVTRIVSRGTVTDDCLLDPAASNYLLAVAAGDSHCGLAWIDVSTGRFEATQVRREQLGDELARIGPVELLVCDEQPPLPAAWTESRMVTTRPSWAFGLEAARRRLLDQFNAATLEGFGFDADDRLAIAAAGAVLDYLAETQKSSLSHIDRLTAYRPTARLELDEATRRSLEITCTIRDGSRDGSLWGVMDQTVTSMGARLLGDWLAAPLVEPAAIQARLDAVAQLHGDPTQTSQVRTALSTIYDLPRLLARITSGRGSPRDLKFIDRTLARLPEVKQALADSTSERLATLAETIDVCDDLHQKLDAALVEDCPLSPREAGYIQAGYHEQLDRQRDLAAGGKRWIAEYQARAIEETGISNMKIGFNRVFGYYLEVTHAQRDKTPDYFIRKQTLKNAERYVTPELKEHEEKVLAAEEQAGEFEYQLFLELRELVAAAAPRLQATAAALAEIDVLAALAELARRRNYVRPTITDSEQLEILGGRHPVLDVTEPEGTFVPNDVSCTAGGEEGPSLLLITGPNMAGKSTYIRQTALLTLMAQIGSFIPAERAVIGVADRIFARVGASDDLARGRSTFMVEMTETARILNTATSRSLVILDEIGRGTSTYDGLSLAWAVAEHLHNAIGCRTLFATHYHELTDLAEQLPGIANYNVSVKEWEDEVVFLHRIVPGAADKSYGIHVAKLAGVPTNVQSRAAAILSELEGDPSARNGRRRDAAHRTPSAWQMTLFETAEHPVVEALTELDLNQLTPLAALELLAEWQGKIARGTASGAGQP